MVNSQEIKEKVKERYTKVAITGDSCCDLIFGERERGGCCSGNSNVVLQPTRSAAQVSELVGYDNKELESIPEGSILGAGCGTPIKFAFKGDTVVDLGSGAGIDVFLAANMVKSNGKVIGIDMIQRQERM